MSTELSYRNLEEKAKLYQDLYDNAPIAYFSVGVDGVIRKANCKAAEILGRDCDDLQGSQVFDLYVDGPEGKEKALAVFQKFTSAQETLSEELQMQRADGTPVWVHLTVKILRDASGTISGSHSMVTDISERKNTERALQEAEEKYQDLYDNAPDMFVSVAAETGKIMQCNLTAATNLGYTREEIIGRHIKDLYHPDSEENRQKTFTTFVEKGTIRDAELQLVRKNGSRIDVSLNISSVRDEQGKVLYSRSIWRDITDHKKMEQELARSENRFREIFTNAPFAITYLDTDFRVLKLNPSMEQLIGHKAEEVKGKHCYDVWGQYAKDDCKKGQEKRCGVCKVSLALEKDEKLTYVRQRGNTFIEVTTSPVKDGDGHIIGALECGNDITERKLAEKALQESETKFRLLAETIEDVFWMSTPGMDKLLYVSPAYERIWGRTRDSLYQNPQSFLDTVHPDDREKVGVGLSSHRQGDYGPIEYRIVRPDGSVGWICDKGFPIRENGEIIALTGIAADITARKQAEEALHKSEEKYRRFFTTVSNGWAYHRVVTDDENRPVDYIFLEVNDTYGELTGLVREDVIGKRVTEVLPGIEHGPAHWIEIFGEVALTGKSISFENYVESLKRWYSVSASCPEEGYFTVIFTDITDRKQLESSFQESNEALNEAQNVAKIGSWWYDPVSKVPTWTEGMFHIFGLKPQLEALPYDDHRKIIHPDDWEKFDAAVTRAVTEGIGYDLELRVTRTNGEIGDINAKCIAEKDIKGIVTRLVGTTQDITERKTAEKELLRSMKEVEEANTELKQFSYVMAHDLKAPIRAISNYSSFLQEDLAESLTGNQKQYLRKLKETALEAGSMVEDLLSLARIGRADIEKKPVDLRELVKKIISSMDSGTDVQIDLTDDDWPTIDSDATLLRQIFQNLIDNALKYNISAVKRVELVCLPAADGGVECFVRDNGIGIGAEYHGQIFRMFERLHPPKEYSGSGVGLALVKRAVERLGGMIRLESTPGKGSTFYLSLPKSMA